MDTCIPIQQKDGDVAKPTSPFCEHFTRCLYMMVKDPSGKTFDFLNHTQTLIVTPWCLCFQPSVQDHWFPIASYFTLHHSSPLLCDWHSLHAQGDVHSGGKWQLGCRAHPPQKTLWLCKSPFREATRAAELQSNSVIWRPVGWDAGLRGLEM